MAAACAFPHKERLTHREAKQRAWELNRFAFDGARVRQYRCPAGGHWHVGHPPRRKSGTPRRRQR